MSIDDKMDFNLFKRRREELLKFILEDNSDLENGQIFLFADFENDRSVFRQESTFYYLTGLEEPGAIVVIHLDGKQVLYLPNYGGIRSKWTKECFSLEKQEKAQLCLDLGFSDIKYLGKSCGSFSFSSIFKKDYYDNFLFDIENFIKSIQLEDLKFKLFAILDDCNSKYNFQIQLIKKIIEIHPNLSSKFSNLIPFINYMRRFKGDYEIDLIYKAVQITNIAHQAAASVISPSIFEYEVQAVIESVFTQTGSMGPAFPSIIATGKNSTILHYTKRDHKIEENDLVVVDIGSQYKYYSADLTRTYPASGKFSPRQLEIYNKVLDALLYAESIVKPGMFLNNPKEPENSLNHLTNKFLEKNGLGKYIAHGIGHHLGLDVHDVDDLKYPLSSGDVFTIEPGIYIPEENIGIRIEDDFVMTNDGPVCLSFKLPRAAKEIEAMMKKDL